MKQGEILKCLLEYRNMDVATLSRITNIPNSTLYSIIRRNNNKTRKEVLAKISKALNVPISIWDEEDLQTSLAACSSEKTVMNIIDKERVYSYLEIKNQPFEYLKYALDCLGYDNRYSVDELRNIIETKIPVPAELASDINYILITDSLVTREEFELLKKIRGLSADSKKMCYLLIEKLNQSDKYEKGEELELVKEMYPDSENNKSNEFDIDGEGL